MTSQATVKAEAEYRIFYGEKSFHLDEKKFKLLDFIHQKGSITEAAKLARISYRTALNYIDKIEKTLGISIVYTKKGGKGGGGSTHLTMYGKELLKKCKIINAMLEIHTSINELEAIVKEIKTQQKIMVIEIHGFKLTLPLKEEYSPGDHILALISFDNIFLMKNKCESSIRNTFKGTISEMSLQKEIIRIKIDLKKIEIYCDITKSASEELNLTLGKEIYAGFKAASIATMRL